MNNLLQTLRNLGPARLAAIGGVGLLLIGFFVYLTTRLSSPEMELLYSDLQQTEAAAIAKKLDEAKVPYSVDKSGTKIMVPADQVGPMRMRMAAQGLPSGRYDSTAALGRVNAELERRFGLPRLATYSGAGLLLDRRRMAQAGLASDAVAEAARNALAAEAGIAVAYTRAEMLSGSGFGFSMRPRSGKRMMKWKK